MFKGGKIITLIDYIYPPVCGFCGKIHKDYLCKKCEIKLNREECITTVRNKENNFQEQMYFFRYEGFLKTYDIIVPVPISKKRKKKRGYNQSLLIAREIASSYNKNVNHTLRVEKNCLYKNIDTIEQSKLNKEQRDINVKGVYKLRNNRILTNKRILLVDDIYTTGNTVRECCHMIKKANPEKIGVLTIARGFVDKRKG